MQRAVTLGPVLISSVGRQYCPELRIPLNCSAGLPCHKPGEQRADVTGDPGRAAGSAMIAWCVFMIAFLFTLYVNTEYGGVLLIYPDLASVFAASALYSYLQGSMVPQKSMILVPVLPGTKV